MIEINKSLVQNFSLDTNYITPPLDFLVNLKDEGMYIGEVFKDDRFYCKIQISCKKSAPDYQTDIELSELSSIKPNHFEVLPDGYAVFYLSEGEEKYNIQLEKNDDLIFDNQSILGNELVGITLFTPGDYECTNDSPVSSLSINVTEVSNDQYNENEPIEVEIIESGFSKSDITIESGQAILFKLAKDSRLRINPINNQEEKKMKASWSESVKSIKKQNTKS
ncbi:hypothetical protein [Pseudoalteromonas sp.]|uniref:hypothetical protein n=1 Tax=Pseudoalteromonas sp. TaxID=53249 RepID=UPI0030016211